MTQIIIQKLNIFLTEADVLINVVNCKGIMGAGLAKQFKSKFNSKYFLDYQNKCKMKEIYPGSVTSYEYEPGKFIYNFATKDDWKNESKIEWIDNGLNELKKLVEESRINTIAMPLLGCGLGGLDKSKIIPLIVKKLQYTKGNRVFIICLT